MGGSEYGYFPLFYVMKMSLRRWVVQKSLITPYVLSNARTLPIKILEEYLLNKKIGLFEYLIEIFEELFNCQCILRLFPGFMRISKEIMTVNIHGNI